MQDSRTIIPVPSHKECEGCVFSHKSSSCAKVDCCPWEREDERDVIWVFEEEAHVVRRRVR